VLAARLGEFPGDRVFTYESLCVDINNSGDRSWLTDTASTWVGGLAISSPVGVEPTDLFAVIPNVGAMTETPTQSGWELVAAEDEAAAVIAGLLAVEPGREYTRSELADAAGVPLKTLYLVDIFEELDALGMLDRVDDAEAESEICYRINEDSDVYQAARQFDEAVDDNR